MTTVELNAGSVVLSPYTSQHDRQTVAWLNTDELRTTFGITRDVTLQSHRRWIETAKDTLVWAIVIPGGGHCGNALLHCNPTHRSAYFQIYVGDPTARGRGVGKRVLVAVLDHSFGTLALHRVWLHTLFGNKAAERLYLGAGFVEEGIERESILRAGRFESQHRWSILADEWRQRRHGDSR
jgi:RimJ/RimL family protein N-acetyltransferase